MKSMISKAAVLVVCGTLLVGINACKENEPQPVGNPSGPSGTMKLELTDAPIDDANVQAVFVTVAEVKVDGKPFPAFTGKKTVNILALQNGNVESLGLSRLEAGTYSNIALVLDYASDASGNAPGCYVLGRDNQKYNLAAGGAQRVEIKANRPVEVTKDAQTEYVFDFDLRKAIKDNNGNTAGGYTFGAEGELQSTVRIVKKARSGAIVGRCANASNNGRVVVYAYAKGQFNRSAEAGSQFRGAITSAACDNNGNYRVSFLEEGEYELHFVSYEQRPNGGSATLKGFLQLSGGVNTNTVMVRSNTEARLDVTVGGLLGI